MLKPPEASRSFNPRVFFFIMKVNGKDMQLLLEDVQSVFQVDSAWIVDKIKNLDNTIAEIGDIKISFADFKTIHHRISKEDEAMMRNLKKKQRWRGSFSRRLA